MGPKHFGLLLPLCLLLFVPLLECANVLFTFEHDKGSHVGSARPMMEMMASRGHNVVVLDTVFGKDQSASVRHIRAQLPNTEDAEQEKQFSQMIWGTVLSSPMLSVLYKRCDGELDVLMRNHSRQMAELFSGEWDLIVVDDLFWALGFALPVWKHRLWEQSGARRGKEPHIVVFATAATGLTSAESVRSSGRNWVSRAPICPFLPADSSDAYNPNTFTHRLSVFFDVVSEYATLAVVEAFLMPNIAKYGVPKFSWYELYSRSQLQLADNIDRMGQPLAIGSNTVSTGAHCKSPKGALPQEFADFMEHPESKGTIYIAFGTHVDWGYAPENAARAFGAAMRRLPQYRFIFVSKRSNKILESAAGNVLDVKWAPQLEVLAHPSVKAFVTHGGSKSVREGLCAGVPLIVMPVYAEQAHTAHLLLAMNIAPIVNKFSVDEESLYRTIHDVLSHPQSLVRARELRSLFLDRPVGALEEAAFAMERLVRDQSRAWRRMTQRRGMHLPWAQFAHLDALAALLGAISALSIL